MAQRILVADDDPSSLEGLRVLLAIWGYEVDTAPDGRVALQKISAAEPKAVITDVVMPVMNGLELLRALRIEKPGVPVIVLTGQGSPDTLARARQQGAYAYLAKPVDVGRLKSVLASALVKREGATAP
ncbi:MAG: response regulator [Candidatus Rokubacteria bacterium]|nr:response regulator [Candidatus Rokubacteria bacterium]